MSDDYQDDYQREQERLARQESARSSQRAGAAQAGLFMFILFVVPIIFAKIVGLIIGLILKMGIVGRVILTLFFIIMFTAFFTIAGNTATRMIFTGQENPGYTSAGDQIVLEEYDRYGNLIHSTPLENFTPQQRQTYETYRESWDRANESRQEAFKIILIVSLALSLILGILWFWFKHYHEIKTFSIGDFAELFKTSFAICFLGGIGMMILFSLMELFRNIRFDNTVSWGLIICVPFIFAVFHWLKKVKRFNEGSLPKKFSFFKFLIKCVLIFFVCIILYSVYYNMGKNQIDPVAHETTASIVTANAEVFADRSPASQAIKILSVGDEVIVLGVNRRYPAWTEIIHEGTKGWIESKDIRINEK